MLTKQKSFSTLIKEADQAFSEYIRLLYAESFTGVVECACGCRQKRHWKNSNVEFSAIQCSHWIPRDNMATRYHEHNALPATTECNYYDPDHAQKIGLKIAKVFGAKIASEVQRLGHSSIKPTRPEIEEIRDHYKERVLELRKRKHL